MQAGSIRNYIRKLGNQYKHEGGKYMNQCFIVIDCTGRYQARFSSYDGAEQWIKQEGLDGAIIVKDKWR